MTRGGDTVTLGPESLGDFTLVQTLVIAAGIVKPQQKGFY